MDSILIYQAANDLVQNTGTRNIKRIARSCSLDISETPRFKDVLGFLSLHFDKPLILINSHLDSQTKQMVCGYALGHYLEHQILMDLHTLNKSLAITDKEICLYEPNAFASHLMLKIINSNPHIVPCTFLPFSCTSNTQILIPSTNQISFERTVDTA